MKKNIKSIYKFEAIILLLDVLLFFIQNNNYKNLITIIGFGILLFVSTLVYKKKRDTNFFRNSALTIVFGVLIFYFVVIFALGLLLGFSKTLFSLKPYNLIHGIIPIFLITVFTEKLKFILIKNNTTEKKAIYAITILMTMFNIFLITNFFTLDNTYKVFVILCTTIIPTIAQEMLSTYMICNYGYLPTIGYKLIINLYIYILPIFTNLGDYLYSIVNVIIPFTIYMVLKMVIKTNEDIRKERKRIIGINLSFITIPTIIFLIIVITLVSGIFRFQMIAIASNSMVPIYERGDAIIFEKVDTQYIESGDIIVFKKNNVLVAHRVIKIKEDSYKKYFYTKGDANKSADSEFVKEEEVIGVVRRVTKYIGYPTVLLNELLGR